MTDFIWELTKIIMLICMSIGAITFTYALCKDIIEEQAKKGRK